MDRVDKQEEPITFHESLTERQVYLEKMMLQLRRSCGLLWHDLTASLTEKEIVRLKEKIIFLCKEGFLIDDGLSIRFTIQGLVVENQIITQLLI